MNVIAEKRPEGFVLVSDDTYKDILAGPFQTPDELKATAVDLHLSIKNSDFVKPTTVRKTIKQLQMGTLFRINNGWYRLLKHDGRNSILEVVGEKTQTTLPSRTEVTQISVLSLQ